MNRAIPDEIVEEIRHRANIVDLIGSYIPLKRAGSGVFKALCPFHQEKTPSFTVNENKQGYHCFGCGAGGDVFRFVMDRENVDFPNAVHLLASRYGVIIPEKTDPAERARSAERTNARERLYRMHEEFAKYFRDALYQDSEQKALQYLYRRGITDEVIEKFQLGFSPDSWDAAVKFGQQLGFNDKELVESGIVRRHEQSNRIYDHFKGRLTFSIWNETGKVVGFSARTLESNPTSAKYVNTPETPIFKKGNILYALPIARAAMKEQNMAILCEGQLDVIAMHRGGFPCAVAPQGTAFTEEQARMLKRYTAKILLAFDADNAGQKAILRALEMLLPLDMEVRVIRFPDGKDPDELYKNSGAEGVAQVVNQSIDWLDFLTGSLAARYQLENPAEMSRAVAELIGYLKLIGNQVAQELYVRRAGDLLKIGYGGILAELGKANRQEQRRFNGAGRPEDSPSSPMPAKVEVDRCELMLLELALNYESAARAMLELIPQHFLSGGLGSRALNLVLDTALNGEYQERNSRIATLLLEQSHPEISKLLVQESKYSEKDVDKVLKDCIFDLKQKFKAAERRRLTEALKLAVAPEEKTELLKQLLELK